VIIISYQTKSNIMLTEYMTSILEVPYFTV